MAGIKTRADKTREKHGADFYKRIGAIGGKKGKKDGTVKGFAANPELARRAGLIGGKVSRRGKKQYA